MTAEEFNLEFETIAPPLKSYLLRITASVHDAEDIVHDTYIKAVDKLYTFRHESSIKTWLFSIASNIAKDNQRVKKRWVEYVTDICKQEALGNKQFFQEAMQIATTSPHGAFEIKEHIAFCFTCISKSLPLEQQLCLYLKEVYEFKVGEIAVILDISEAMVVTSAMEMEMVMVETRVTEMEMVMEGISEIIMEMAMVVIKVTATATEMEGTLVMTTVMEMEGILVIIMEIIMGVMLVMGMLIIMVGAVEMAMAIIMEIMWGITLVMIGVMLMETLKEMTMVEMLVTTCRIKHQNHD